MPVTVGNGTATPVVGTETDVATIAPGTPLDVLSVYVVGGTGGGNGPLEFALYATVGGFRTRVAQKLLRGTDTPTLIDWDTGLGPLAGGGNGDAQTDQLDVGGTNYTLTVIDRSTNFSSSPRNPVSATIAAVDSFDTAADANFGSIFALTPGATGTLTLFPGYAQLMDVAIDQTNLPPVTVTVTADCGLLSVLGTVVKSVQMSGRDEDIASVFRGLKLPAATEYFVSVTNNSRNNIGVTLTGVTYSESITAGGIVVLNGDVIGPSNNNTVIKWSNVPLLRLAAHGFAPGDLVTDAEIPIFDLALGTWRAFALSGDATMDNTGVVTINPAAIVTLGGDVTGPSNNNTDVKWSNVPLLRGVANGFAPGDLLDAEFPIFNAGLGLWRAFVMSGDATMTDAGVVTINPAFVNTLTGNVVGPSNENKFTSFVNFVTNGAPSFTIPFAGANPGLGWWYVGSTGLVGARTVILPAGAAQGEVVVVTDEDGILTGGGTITVNGSGFPVNHATPFVMNATYPGQFGSIALQFDGVAWFIFADYSPNAAGSGVVTLTGNVNGPSNANRFLSLMLPANNASVVVPTVSGWTYVGFSNLAGPQSVTLPAAPTDGAVVVVTDEDGSLVAQTFSVIGAPHLVEGASPFLMNATYPGTKGSIALQFDASAPGGGQWFIFSDYSPNAASSVALVGNVNGPAGSNAWTSFVLPNTSGVPVTTIPFAGPVPGDGWWYVAVTGTTVNRTVNLPAAPTSGEVVVITDEGVNAVPFLSPGNTITVNGNGPLVEGFASIVMTNAYPGEFGSICLQFDGTNWYIFADYSPNAALVATLAGNANGPAGANRFLSLIAGAAQNADILIPEAEGYWYAGFAALTATRTCTLPLAPVAGEVVVVKDEDGSLASGSDIIIDGNGKNIDGAATVTMTNIDPGPFGSITVLYTGASWSIV